MKLIEKKEQKKVPELIWGAKYKVIASSCFDDIAEGETVILASAREDSEGHVRVFSEDEWDYLKPEQLQLISVETTEEPETTYVIEFTESELKVVVELLGDTVGELGFREYSVLDDILQGEDK